MTRQLLDEKMIHPNIKESVGGKHNQIIEEVKEATNRHSVVIVGMAQNPVCKKIKKYLNNENIDFHYLEYGSYFKDWKKRLVLKMWSGWSTFPMAFVNGQLVGGCSEVSKLLKSGELKKLLADNT